MELSVKRINICQGTSTAFRVLYLQDVCCSVAVPHIWTVPPQQWGGCRQLWMRRVRERHSRAWRSHRSWETLSPGMGLLLVCGRVCLRTPAAERAGWKAIWKSPWDATMSSDRKNTTLRSWKHSLCRVPSSQRERYGYHNPRTGSHTHNMDAVCPRRVSYTVLRPGWARSVTFLHLYFQAVEECKPMESNYCEFIVLVI